MSSAVAAAATREEVMEGRDSLPRKSDDRSPRTLAAECRVTEMEEGTAVYISSSDAHLGARADGSKDSSMDIAPSLITLYDKYASTDSELMSIKEDTATKTESPDRTSSDGIITAKTRTTEIAGNQGDTIPIEATDTAGGPVSNGDAHAPAEPTDDASKAEEVYTMPKPPINQSFLYSSLSSVKSDFTDEEKDTFETPSTSLKPRSESCPGILDEDCEPSTNATVETEIERTTAAPTESKPKTSNVEFKSPDHTCNSWSASLEKNSNPPPRRKSSVSSPPERTDTNANLRGFQRTLSFGARLARTKFSQFIESNALGKSKSEAPSNKKASEATTAKPRTRLRSDSEPPPISAIKMDHKRKSSRINPIISCAVEVDSDVLSPVPSPVSTPPLRSRFQQSCRNSLSYMDQKCKELIDTEESYVMDLVDVIQGYKKPLATTTTLIPENDQNILFGNIEEIHNFNNKLLTELQQCNNDPVLIAECFLDNEKNFQVYTDYCTNYPSTMEVLIDYTKYEVVAEFFKECQLYLGHPLPLGAYLLKPVQRVLKYHLLFQDMYKHFDKDEEGYETIGDALVCMTGIAHYINEMKRKHEASVHVQEIQSQLVGWEGDLMSSGDLVLEDVFRMQGARAERYLYLFEKVLLIGKKREDGLISIKTYIPCSNLMLIESIQKEPLGFNVIPFDNPSIQYTILARNVDQKKLWSHEIKRLILENYGSTIPTKVYELILRSTKTDSDKEPPQEPDLTRDRKERKSKRRQKQRRNSEPMGKLIRGQKQVKAAVESMITKGMKRPEMSKLNGRRSSGDVRAETCHTTDESDNESFESPHRQSSSRLNESTPERRSSLSACSDSTRTPDSRSPDKQPIADNLSRRLSRNSLELDGSVSSTHSDEEKYRAAEQSNLTKKRESNRDSGIGSMTLSEHTSTEGDRDANGSARRSGTDRGKSSEDSAKKLDPARRRLGLDGSEEDDNAIEELIENMDSPDELEALESLPEIVPNASVGHEDAVDLESLPSYIKMEPFKLRCSNMRSYRPLVSHKNGDVWLPMSDTYVRNRSASYGTRPLSADVAMHVPLKVPLSRSNSDDRCMLAAVSEMHSRSHSDPNMLDTNTEERSGSPPHKEQVETSPSSQGPSGELSSHSSNENLLESVNNAFKKLGEKYSQYTLSDNEDAKTKTGKDESDNLTSMGTVSTSERFQEENQSSVQAESHQPERDAQAPPPVAPKTVIKLAREFSRKAKESPKLVVTRHVFSDPYVDRDGTAHTGGFSIKEDKDGHAVVRPKTVSKVTSKIETFQRAMTENESWTGPTRGRARHISDSIFHATPVWSTGSSSDEEQTKSPILDSTPTSLSRSGRNRRLVRDVVSKFEKPSSTKKESKVVTPVSMGIQQRLEAIRQNTEFHNKQSQEANSSKIKSLRERRQELQEWISRPIPKRYNKTESYSDTASFCSDEPDGMSSYGGSLQSSAHASPVHVARGTVSLTALESFTEPTPQDTEPLFRSLKDRFQELEKAVSKPVPRTCANPKQEIEAEKQNKAEEQRLLSQSSIRDEPEECTIPEAEVEEEAVLEEEAVSKEKVEEEETGQEKQCKGDAQGSSCRPNGMSSSSPVFLIAEGSEGLHRAVSCESNYTDARSEFSTQDSSEESFHSGYATPTES